MANAAWRDGEDMAPTRQGGFVQPWEPLPWWHWRRLIGQDMKRGIMYGRARQVAREELERRYGDS